MAQDVVWSQMELLPKLSYTYRGKGEGFVSCQKVLAWMLQQCGGVWRLLIPLLRQLSTTPPFLLCVYTHMDPPPPPPHKHRHQESWPDDRGRVVEAPGGPRAAASALPA